MTTGNYTLSAQFLPTINVPQTRERVLTTSDGIDSRFPDKIYYTDDYALTGVQPVSR